MNYNLNKDAAKKADSAPRITETGPYTGYFTKAKPVTSKKGSRGIEFDFVTKDGTPANRLTIWTLNSSNEPIFGYNQIMSLMTCLNIGKLYTELGTVKEYNWDTKKVESIQTQIYPELQQRAIGVVLQAEEYENQNHEIKQRMVIHSFFHPESRKVASEIIDNKRPEMLDKIIKGLPAIRKLKQRQTGSDFTAQDFPPDEVPF